MLVNTIQELYKEYRRLDVICETAMDAAEMDIENEELDKIADEAYTAMWQVREELVQLLMRFTKVSRQAVNKMLASDKFEELMNCRIA